MRKKQKKIARNIKAKATKTTKKAPPLKAASSRKSFSIVIPAKIQAGLAAQAKKAGLRNWKSFATDQLQRLASA